MMDASFEVIENIRKHPDADKLDLAEIGGYTNSRARQILRLQHSM